MLCLQGGGAARRGDTRSLGNFVGGANVRNSTNANTEFFGRARIVSANSTIFEPPNGLAVLAPGTNFTVVCEANATLIDASFSGYQRLAEPSELSF